MAAFPGMHVSPAKHSDTVTTKKSITTNKVTTGQIEGQTSAEAILMCRYALQAHHGQIYFISVFKLVVYELKYKFMFKLYDTYCIYYTY